MEIQGRIIQVLPQASGVSKAGNNWRKQEYILETKDQYPRKVIFNFFNNTIDQYPLQLGDDIILSFDLESRSFVGRDGVERWSTDVRGFRAEKVDPAMSGGFQQPVAPQYQPQPGQFQANQFQQPQPAVPQFPVEQQAPVAGNGPDDLPF